MALANIASNMKNQPKMVKMGILEPLEMLARLGLDAKTKSDGEAERYALLSIANLSVSPVNHKFIISDSLPTLIGFSKSSDIKCRQHAMFALGNLASDPTNLDHLIEGKVEGKCLQKYRNQKCLQKLNFYDKPTKKLTE